MIRLVTGDPGAGKSYYTVRRIVQALDQGKWVATNVDLFPGWEIEAAKSNQFRRLIPGRVDAIAVRNARHTFVSPNLSELMKLRLPPCGKCRGCKNGSSCKKEGRGIMVLDEAHEWLNARTWDTDSEGMGRTRAEATHYRLQIVKFFARHRKLGWDIDLVTQDEKRLDNQVRGNFRYHVHLKNLKSFRIPVIGIPIFPINFFVAVTTWNDNDKTRLGVETYLLNRRIANLYDSMALPPDLAEDAEIIWMGSHYPGAISSTPVLEGEASRQAANPSIRRLPEHVGDASPPADPPIAA